MIGAILGDMIGAPYEFDRGKKTKDFPLFTADSQFTDDTVMTIAVAEALLELPEDAEDSVICNELVSAMRRWGNRYPHAGYGARFRRWLRAWNPEPYNSYGNGSAMRVSSAGWLYSDLDETRRKARLTAVVTHNHPEGIKARKQRQARSSSPEPAAARKKSKSTSYANSVMICPGPATRSARPIAMWRAARELCRKRLRHSWRGRISRM